MKLRKWLFILLLWQIGGIIVTIIASIPMKDTHYFIHDLLLTLTFTNCVAIMSSAWFFFYNRVLKDKIRISYIRIGSAILVLALVITIALKISLVSGRYFCGLDFYQVGRWHLAILIFDLIMLTVISVLCILYFLYIKLSENLANKIRENEKLQRLQIESKLAILQSKVNPHFLFNTLNTMMDMVHENPDKLEKMIFNLSDIYRKVLTLPDNELVQLKDELQLVREYLEIERTRMGDRLDFDIAVEEELLSFKIPPIILQILVENAILHGISPQKKGGSIDIQINRNNNKVQIKVTDDGVGIKRNYMNTGFGIYSIQQRLQLLYNDKATFDISLNPDGGTQVRLELPYEN